MINGAKMLSDCPASLHREVQDAAGVWHDSVLTQTELAPALTQYGITFSAATDTLFVATPFVLPPGERIALRQGESAAQTRRVDSVTDNVDFLAIVLGEVC